MNKVPDFGCALESLSRRFVMRLEARAGDVSLTPTQREVLVRLKNHQGASQARLAKLLGVAPMAVTRILGHLEARGLLERRADPEDRRARCLYLTLKAQSLVAEIQRAMDETHNEIFVGIEKADRQLFMRLLRRLYRNVCTFDDSPFRPTDAGEPIGSLPATQTGPMPRVARPRVDAGG